jgi:hypothetical protein
MAYMVLFSHRTVIESGQKEASKQQQQQQQISHQKGSIHLSSSKE